MTISTILNKYLKIFDNKDSKYQSLISNDDGIPDISIDTPIDFNIGAIASLLEWNRQLSLTLTEQIFLDKATANFLDLIAHEHIGIVRYSGESDLDFIARLQKFIIGKKISPAAIIFCTTPFSSPGPPVLLEGLQDISLITSV